MSGSGTAAEGDLPVENATTCACDCQSYCADVAERYAADHIRRPAWFGGKGTPIPVELVGTSCHYPPGGGVEPCDWFCRAELKGPNDRRFMVTVMLLQSRVFYALTDSPEFPSCGYTFGCDPFELTEFGCVSRTTVTPITPQPSGVYIVQPGDWLAKIASDHGLTLAEIQRANPHLGPPERSWSTIYPGDRVNLPAGGQGGWIA